MLHNLSNLFKKKLLFIALLASANSIHSMEEKSCTIPVSTMALALEKTQIADDLLEFIKILEACEPEYLQFLTLELLNKRSIEFIKAGEYAVTSQDLSTKDRTLLAYKHSPYTKNELSLLSHKETDQLSLELSLNDGTSLSYDIPEAITTHAGEFINAAWLSKTRFVLLFEHAIVKYLLKKNDDSWRIIEKKHVLGKEETAMHIATAGTMLILQKHDLSGDKLFSAPLYPTDSLDEISNQELLGPNERGLDLFAVSKNGKILIAGNGSNKVYVFEHLSYSTPMALSERTIDAPEKIKLITCDPRGTYAGLAATNKCSIAHVPSRKISDTVVSSDDSITALSYSPCSRYLLIGLKSGDFIVYNTQLRIRTNFSNPNNTHQIEALYLNPENDQLLIIKKNIIEQISVIGELSKHLTWKEALFLLKAYQHSLDTLCEQEVFDKIFKSMKKESAQDSKRGKTLKSVVTYLTQECKSCIICKNEKASCTTDCNHKFCKTCIVKSLTQNPTCPICRQEIRKFESLEGKFEVNFEVSLIQK